MTHFLILTSYHDITKKTAYAVLWTRASMDIYMRIFSNECMSVPAGNIHPIFHIYMRDICIHICYTSRVHSPLRTSDITEKKKELKNVKKLQDCDVGGEHYF